MSQSVPCDLALQCIMGNFLGHFFPSLKTC
ncbi:hypothetical protein DSM3645_03128 [Blastopirellula marina DSM 3645]|uniref:Uncharacterized protein n=1 Tax=Blastopirellula marina DSM 3645 TaxID=314230 RepID=A3ZVT9_9BACT|nr:hypothetical protein DSM3645_03128 [Blastopirellula marina DSM 3645]